MNVADFDHRFAAAKLYHDIQRIRRECDAPTQSRSEFQAERAAEAAQKVVRDRLHQSLLRFPGATLEALGVGTDEEREVVARLVEQARFRIFEVSRAN